jgi:hypothetical protein
LHARPGWANGSPALLVFEADGTPHRLLVLEVAPDGRSFGGIRAYAESELSRFAG